MRNCNLELQHPSADSRFPNPNETQHQEQKQRLTIFYNGMVCVYRASGTVLQARFILFLANKEMEEKVNSLFTPQSGSAEPPSPNVMSPLCSPVAGMSMKKSLQRFLQKRKHRTQATSPFHH
ncbi:protein TIFY 5A-like [Pyrus x bretschneideri]|uniref:protein TIFY 5A-like n=1 Tax=Pyrus x bretschneideri TaxID=225117 RepID=UPI0020308304|nr:protein TIFY 5A-like [Pyrus x bretschneideri]